MSHNNKNKWILATQKAAAHTGKSYGETLRNTDHRIQYHRNACDPSKMHRGGTLLPYHHPAATPVILVRDHSTPTPSALQARAQATEHSKQNTIRYLKHLRTKK